jgi:hypothetical protein
MDEPTSFWKVLMVQDVTLSEEVLRQRYFEFRPKAKFIETLVATAAEAPGKELDWDRLSKRLVFCERETAPLLKLDNPLVSPWNEDWIKVCIRATRLASELGTESGSNAELDQLVRVIFAKNEGSLEDAGVDGKSIEDQLYRARVNVTVALLSGHAPKAEERIPVVFEESRESDGDEQRKSLRGGRVESQQIEKRAPADDASTESKSGVLAWMHLKLLPGLPCSANHPEYLEQGPSVEFPVGFMTDMRGAWDWAWQFTHASEPADRSRQKQTASNVCGCWQLLPWETNAFIQPNIVSGPSLTAAMVRAWSLMLQGRRVDSRVMVIGKLLAPPVASPNWELAAVNNEAVKRKVARVYEVVTQAVNDGKEPPIDRIVVFSNENKAAAMAELGETLCPSVVDVQLLGS